MIHHIEERAIVYLRMNDDRTGWVIDSPTCDGSPLFGYDDGPVDDECPCNYDDERESASHQRAYDTATQLPLPTAEELLELLADELGYALLPKVPA